MNNIIATLLFLSSLLLGISCHKEPIPILLKIDSIKIDTSLGYPYPANYNWEEWVKKGYYDLIHKKNKYSWEPLVNIIRNKNDEVYRMDFGLIKCIVYADSNIKEITIQKDSVLKWNNKSPWKFSDSIVKLTRNIKLSNKKWDKTINLINKVNLFRKNTIDYKPRFIDDGYSWQLEGIKNQYYNLIYRVCPEKNYEKELYKLGIWILKISGENIN